MLCLPHAVDSVSTKSCSNSSRLDKSSSQGAASGTFISSILFPMMVQATMMSPPCDDCQAPSTDMIGVRPSNAGVDSMFNNDACKDQLLVWLPLIEEMDLMMPGHFKTNLSRHFVMSLLDSLETCCHSRRTNLNNTCNDSIGNFKWSLLTFQAWLDICQRPSPTDTSARSDCLDRSTDSIPDQIDSHDPDPLSSGRDGRDNCEQDKFVGALIHRFEFVRSLASDLDADFTDLVDHAQTLMTSLSPGPTKRKRPRDHHHVSIQSSMAANKIPKITLDQVAYVWVQKEYPVWPIGLLPGCGSTHTQRLNEIAQIK